MGKYIDGSGLSHFMGIIKGYFVPKTRKVNGHALSTDVTVTASDIGVASGAEVNQNAFSNVKVGSTTVAADTKTDTLELVAGSNVTLTPDATNDKVTIAAKDTTYSNFVPPTASAPGDSGLVPAPNAGDYQFGILTVNGWDTLDGLFYTYVGDAQSGWVYYDSDADEYIAVKDLTATDIPNLSAAKITSGTFDAARIPSLAASKITSGTFDAARIPSLAISKVTNLQTTLDAKAPLANPALTGTPTAPTAAAGTNTTQIATTAFVTNAVGTATAGALQYKGTVSAESTITGAAYKKGWYYVVATAGTYVGKVCEVGDMLIAKQDKTSTPANDWDAIQSNIEVLSNSEIDTLWAAA